MCAQRVGLQRRSQFGRHAGGCGHFDPSALNLGRAGKPLALTFYLADQHQRHQRGALAAVGRHGHAGGPHIALPALCPFRCGFDDFRRFRKELQRFALQGCRQSGDRHLEQLARQLDLAVAVQGVGLRLETGVERGAIECGGAAHRQVHHKLALFGNALAATHQPTGFELDLQVGVEHRRLERRGDGERHR